MQRGNMITFMVLSLLILLGWTLVQKSIWGPKEAAKKKETAQKEQPVDWAKWGETARASNLVAHRLGSGDALVGMAQLYADLERIHPSPPPPSTREINTLAK